MKANISHIRTATVQYQGEFRVSKAKEAATPFVESAEELIEEAAARGAWAVASFRVKDFPTEEAYHAYCDYFEAIGYTVFFCQSVIVICWEPSCRKPDEHPEDEKKLQSCPDPHIDEIALKIQHTMQPIVNELFENTLVRELEVNVGGWCVTCKQR